jgi:hypothetical protein
MCALPVSRNITYAAGDPVRHADFNDFQDQIIALYAGKRPSKAKKMPLAIARLAGGLTGTFNDDGSFTMTGGGAGTLRVPLIVHAGERIQSVRARVDPAATGAVGLALVRYTDLVIAAAGSGVTSSGGAIQTIQTPDINEIVADDARISYFASFSFAVTTGHVVIAADYFSDFP